MQLNARSAYLTWEPAVEWEHDPPLVLHRIACQFSGHRCDLKHAAHEDEDVTTLRLRDFLQKNDNAWMRTQPSRVVRATGNSAMETQIKTST